MKKRNGPEAGPDLDDPSSILGADDATGKQRVFDGRRGRGRRLFPVVLAVLSGGLVLVALGALIGLWALTRDLPALRSLDDYRPPQATVIYGASGEVVGRFAKERRTVVPYDRMPRVMVDAVLAAEDADFFQHEGVDFLGIARCVVKNLLSGRKRCGGSTITQQTVKTFFLTPEKTYLRKLRELVLAKRVEEALSKKEILFLYLNQIYFGHGAYGVQEASRVYFGKDVEGLSVEEAALLAGLPQSPARLDPYKYPDRARERRAYVLGRLHQLGKIDEATRDQALAAPIELAWGQHEAHLDNGSHFIDQIRRLLVDDPQIGEERLLAGGLAVYSGLDPRIQAAADDALRQGVEAIDARQGYRGPLLHLEPPEAKALVKQLEARLREVDPTPEDPAHGQNGGDAPPSPERASKDAQGPVIFDLAPFGAAARNADTSALAELARTPRFQLGAVYGGLVVEVEDAARQAVVALGSSAEVVLPLRTGLGWARPFNVERWTARPRRPSDVLERGDVVLVRATRALEDKPRAKGRYVGVLAQAPLTEAAVVVIDPPTREVRALSGGYGTGAGTFNRAVQARRQAGSTFKPVVYAAAFETRRYTPISKCLDAPQVFRDPWLGRSWKPQNYEGTFDGEITFRTALTLSKNVCSVRLIEELGVDPVLEVAKRIGIGSDLPRNLTLALGSGDVTPLEMVNAYTTLADAGRYADPIFVRKVVAPDGTVLLERRAEHRQVIDPLIAYQVVSMMQSVVEEGTAQSVKSLERPVAGKTGTTNESRNAWFIGFTPQLVAGVWVGFDDNRPLGPNETGGRAAIPIWLETMKAALEDEPPLDFVPPSDMVFALVDPETGLLAPPGHEGARTEAFLPGTEPTEVIEAEEPADRGLMDDYE